MLLSGLLATAPGAMAQEQPPSATQETAPAVQSAPPTPVPANQAEESEAAQTLHLLVGRSLVITSPARIRRVSLADPNIAEAIVVSPTQVLLNGKTPGGVSLLIWDETGQSQAFEVSVDIDVLGLSQKIHEVFPSEDVHIDTSRDVVILTGKISSSGGGGQDSGSGQERFAKSHEHDASSSGAHGRNPAGSEVRGCKPASDQPAGHQYSEPAGRQERRHHFDATVCAAPADASHTSGVRSTIGVSDLMNIFLFRPDINLAATIKALENETLLQILAQPNLMTQSGKEASFLAGGEFPFPVVQSSGGGGFAGITIQFKEFGVRLKFTPTLTADGLIHLKVTPEVSALDFTNAVTLQGFTIPALTVDRVESEMELRDGQSFAIAGLLDNRVTEQLSKIPWIGDVPVLGNLFKSRSLTKSKNELLIVVTPRIVRPLDKEPAGPVMPKTFIDPQPAGVAHPTAPK